MIGQINRSINRKTDRKTGGRETSKFKCVYWNGFPVISHCGACTTFSVSLLLLLEDHGRVSTQDHSSCTAEDDFTASRDFIPTGKELELRTMCFLCFLVFLRENRRAPQEGSPSRKDFILFYFSFSETESHTVALDDLGNTTSCMGCSI